MFSLLHTKSDYSLGHGTASVEELVGKAAGLGYRALALTDLESMAGQIRFHQHCRSAEIKPVTGIELRPEGYHRNRKGRIVLLASDFRGYQSLCGIINSKNGVPGRSDRSRSVLELVKDNHNGIYALSDDPEVIESLCGKGGCFPVNRLGLLLVRPDNESRDQARIEAAKKLGVAVIADLDVVFLSKTDYPLHVLQAKIAKKDFHFIESKNRLLQSPAEAEALFADIPEAVIASEEIAGQCTLDLTKPFISLPSGDLLTGLPADEILRERCNEAKRVRIEHREWDSSHSERLSRELDVFRNLGISSYILVLTEIVNHCRSCGIPVTARGSAVSSLTLNVLGISSVDPVREGLLFERFLHERKSLLPDVDVDLPSSRRNEVINWIFERFGPDRVAMVSSHHTFQARSALREGLKALGFQEKIILKMMRALPPEDLQEKNEDLRKSVQLRAKDVRNPANLKIARDLKESLSLTERLIGHPRTIAAHPGGVIFVERPLGNFLPLQRAAKGVVVTQYNYNDISGLGIMKLDLLGNAGLSEIEESLELAGNDHPERLEDIPADDPRTLSLIDHADTVGCFQLESPAMRSLLAKIPIRNQDDIVSAIALVRPGAAADDAKSTFIRRARGEESDHLFEPAVSDRLAGTHGLILFEEDIMVLLGRMGGLDMGEADIIRHAIVESGGDPQKLSLQKKEFLDKARANGKLNEFSELRISQSWDAAAKFAAYTFNKAHSASYGRLAYMSAYLKLHYPAQFTCALINHYQGLYPLRTIAAEMSRRGVAIRPPHVNSSVLSSSLLNSEVIIGLDKIKILSEKNARKIVNERLSSGRYNSFIELLKRARIPFRELQALVLSGACDGLAPLDPGRYPFIHESVLLDLKERIAVPSDRASGMENENSSGKGPESTKIYQRLVRARNELRYLEMHPSGNPMAILRPESDRYGCTSIRDAVVQKDGSSLKLAVLVSAMRRVRVSTGIIQFATLEDETGLLEAVVLPSAYRMLGERITTPGPYLVEGELKFDRGSPSLEVASIFPFFKRRRPFGREAGNLSG